MKKLVDAAIVAALLMLAVPDLPLTDAPPPPPAQVTEAVQPSHGDRPC